MKERLIRSNFNLKIDVSDGEKIVPLKTRNVSLSGIFIETERKFNVGDNLNLTLLFDREIPNLSFDISCRVVRTEKDGIGVKFNDMNEDVFLHLYKTILDTCNDGTEFLSQCDKIGIKL